MSQAVAQATFSGLIVRPCFRPDLAIKQPVNLPPLVTLAAGTVLGQVTTAANDVQTMTIGGTPTGGTFTLTITNPITGGTAAVTLAYNSTVAQTQAAVNAAVGAGIVTVSGGTLPGSTQIFTYNGTGATNRPVPIITGSATGLTGGTPTFAVAHTTVGATPGQFGAYASGNSDGTQVPRGILQDQCATDAAGLITHGSAAAGLGLFSSGGHPDTTMWAGGGAGFDTSQLTGLDANAVTLLGGHLSSGTVTNGILIF